MRFARAALAAALLAAVAVAPNPALEDKHESKSANREQNSADHAMNEAKAAAKAKQEECDQAKREADLKIAIAQMAQDINTCVVEKNKEAAGALVTAKEEFRLAKVARATARSAHDREAQTIPGKMDELNAKFCDKVKAEQEIVRLEEEYERHKCECQFKYSCMQTTGADDCSGFPAGPFRTTTSIPKAGEAPDAKAKAATVATGCGVPVPGSGRYQTELKDLKDAEAAAKTLWENAIKANEEQIAKNCQALTKSDYISSKCTGAKPPSMCSSTCNDARSKPCEFTD